MKRIITGLVVASLLSVSAFLPSCQSTKSASATKLLRFNLENGKGYDYEVNTTIDQDILGQPMKAEMSFYYAMDVTGDDGNIKTINTRFDRIKMDMSVAGIKMDVDTRKNGDTSTKNPTAQLTRVFRCVTGRSLTMNVDAEGNVLSVKGAEEMAKAIADSLVLDGEDRKEMMERVDNNFGERMMKGQYARFFYIFPNKQVKVGDSWERSTEVGGQLGGEYHSTYKVTAIEGDMVTLDEVSTIKPAGKDADGSSMKGDVKGVLVVDSRSGLLVNADQDIDMKISKNGMEIVLKAKTKVKGKARG